MLSKCGTKMVSTSMGKLAIGKGCTAWEQKFGAFRKMGLLRKIGG
jgi:hypothetical protein